MAQPDPHPARCRPGQQPGNDLECPRAGKSLALSTGPEKGSPDRAVTVAQWYDPRLETRETRVRTLPWASKQWSRDYPIDIPATPTLPAANLRYQEALDLREWTKGGCSLLLLSAQF